MLTLSHQILIKLEASEILYSEVTAKHGVEKQPPLCAIDHFIILVGKPEYGCPTRDGCFFVVVVCLFFGQ